MSHEMRTPINAIVGFAQLLERRWLSVIQQAGRHAISGLDEHIAASHLECRRMESEPLMLSELITVCISMVSELARPRRIETDLTADPRVPVDNVARLLRIEHGLIPCSFHLKQPCDSRS